MRKLEIFFDYECPHCKRGVEYFLELWPKHEDLAVIWRLCEAHPRPEEHPPHTDLAIQGFFYAKELGIDLVEYNTLMFDAVHTDRIDVEDIDTLVEYAQDLINPDAFRDVLKAGTYKEVQEAANNYAYEENEVWYLPALRLDGKKLDAEGGIGIHKADLEKFLDEE